ncbi:hypothetical protein [Vibrio sp. TRT 1302]|uniref:hypothetical protein n=1 Tax=Vibrio sp. TRT 1302 TaxID=3418504 RepID=UPI003CF1445E
MGNKVIFYIVITLMIFSRVALLTLTDGALLREQFILTNVYSVGSDVIILLGLYLSAYKKNVPYIFALVIVINTIVFALYTVNDMHSVAMTESENIALWGTWFVYYSMILKSLFSLVKRQPLVS